MNLTEAEIMELRQQANGRALRADLARRARLILLLAEGLTWSAIRARRDCNDRYIALWASALLRTVWQACFLAMPVASATRSPTALRRVCWRARPSRHGSTRLNCGSPRSSAT